MRELGFIEVSGLPSRHDAVDAVGVTSLEPQSKNPIFGPSLELQ